MASVKDMVGRLGLLAIAMALCAMKFLYTFTLELHTTGGEAAYILILHDVYVAATLWTGLLAMLVMTTGAASIKDMGSLKFLHSSYFLFMAAVAAYSIFNDAIAMSAAVGAHNYILLSQFGLELVIVLLMGQQLWSVVASFGASVVDGVKEF